VKTINVSDITMTTVLTGGTVTNDGGAEITDIGICWDTSPNPTISSNKKSYGTGIASFTGRLTGLIADTRYFIRAYATNSAGTSYGKEITFMTDQIIQGSTIPTLTTIAVTSITSSSAVSGGNITDDGGGDIIVKGISWSTTPDWNIYFDDTKIYGNGPGSGSFVSYLSNLNPATTYYVKAYAVNSVGIAFGPTLSFTTSFDPGGTGIRKADFPPVGGRYQAAGFSIGTKIYMGLGYDWDDNYQNDFWEWDQATNVWANKADFPGNFSGRIVSFSIGTKGYLVVNNYNYLNINSSTNDLWEYDPAANGWTQKASLPSVKAGSVAFSIGTKGYIGCGYDDDVHAARDFWEWDQATNVWTKKDDYPGSSTVGAVGFSIGNKGYIGTGNGYGNTLYKDFWEWDQSTNVWTMKADFGGASRSYAVGFSIGNKGYIGTGSSNSALLKDFWEWDQDTNVWTMKADFKGIARSLAVGFSIGNKAYIGTGMGRGSGNEYAIKDLWEYDPNLK
jgi:hypothetical protein